MDSMGRAVDGWMIDGDDVGRSIGGDICVPCCASLFYLSSSNSFRLKKVEEDGTGSTTQDTHTIPICFPVILYPIALYCRQVIRRVGNK